MSELFEESGNPPGVSRRARIVIWAVASVILLFFTLTTFAGVWTDHLWFDSLGYGKVFSTIFWVKIALFLAFGGFMAGALALTLWLAYRSRPFLHPVQIEAGLERYRDAVNPIRTWLWIGVSALAGVFAGVSAATRWRTVEMWWHGTPFGTKDPYFHKDVGFYVFDLPWLHMVVSFVMAVSVVCLLGSVLTHYLYGGIRLQSPGDRLSSAAQVQFSALLAIFVLAKGVDYWLDRYDLTNSQSPLFTGIGYTDDNAVLPAKSALAGIAIICAVLFLINIWRRTWLLPGMGVALMAASAILLGLIWPAIVQTVTVNPSKADKENPYQATNIAQTRAAYAIDDANVKVEDYNKQATAKAADEEDLNSDVGSAPIVDPLLAHELFESQQQSRSYYTVPEVLDVDRYELDGQDRALVLGVRELSPDTDAADVNQNWTNLHTVYTHGSGVIAAYANQRSLSNLAESEQIQWAQGSQASQNDLVTAGPGKFEQRVYFGEQSTDYSIVGRPEGAAPVELDLTTGSSSESSTTEDTTTTYDGVGGVAIGSTWKQLLYAIKFNSANFLLSERVNDKSKVLYDRTPKQRVQKVAPWLTLDDDAYPVVANGRITWVLDGYTTTDRYPGSQSESYQTMTDDTVAQRQTQTGVRTVPTDEINYMRNAVKATVDAYDGTVTLYAWDESDPILKTWSKVFPGTVQPKSTIPPWLLPHLRYPEDLFKVQRYQLAKYHVTDAEVFLQKSDWWQVTTDPNRNTSTTLQAPYRMFMDSAETKTSKPNSEVWALSATFVPNGRDTLAAIMTVNSDAEDPENYGRITVLERPGDQTQGPGQVSASMRNDAGVAQELLPYKDASLGYGSLLTIPTSENGLLYLMPVYAKQAGASYPQLVEVLVSYNGVVGYGSTLSEALTLALSKTPTTPGTGGTPTSPPTTSPSSSPTTSPTAKPSSTPGVTSSAESLLAEAQDLFVQADQAGRDGDYAERENLLKQAEAKVNAALAKLQ